MNPVPRLKSLKPIENVNNNIDDRMTARGNGELIAPACAICLSQTTNNLCALSCGHVFHHPCVLAWFRSSKQSPKCPTCKKAVTSNNDIIKLYYAIEENDGSYFPTPRIGNSNTIASQKTYAEYGTQTEASGNKNNSESNLKLQLQVERSRCSQMQQKLMNVSRNETKQMQKMDEIKRALNVARERLKDVSECSDREKWLREQLANSERNAEDRYDVIHKQYLQEKNNCEEMAEENINMKKMMEMINSDLVMKSRETLMLKKNSTLLKKKNTEINKTIKVMDQAYARLKMTNDHLKTQLDKITKDKDLIGAREAALKDAMEHMFTKRNEREKLTKEYKRILTIRKNRSATASLATVNNNNIAPSPLRVVVPPPSAERLKQLLESDVSDRAEAVLANGSRLSKSNSQPPQWFASNSRVPR
jgi:hypothetical protein